MGSEQDPTWWDFPQSLTETGGARRYVTLIKAPFQASVLTDHENNALRAGSLMVITPPPPGSQPLAGSLAVNLLGNNLTQWASHMQEVTLHMRWPPEAAMSCPQSDIIGVLDWLEGLTRVQYCQHCHCSVVPHQAPGLMAALWMPPTMTYAAMASSTETTASASAAGVTARVTYHLKGPLSSPWTLCRLPLRRTCWPLPALVGAASHRCRRKCPLPLVSVRRDLR